MDNFGPREHLVLLSGHVSDDPEVRNSYPRYGGRNDASYPTVDRIFSVLQTTIMKRFIMLALLKPRNQCWSKIVMLINP